MCFPGEHHCPHLATEGIVCMWWQNTHKQNKMTQHVLGQSSQRQTLFLLCGYNFCISLIFQEEQRQIALHFLISFVHSLVECFHFLRGQEQCSCVMSDAPLYVVNMFYYYWLIRRLILPRVRQNISTQILIEKQREGRQSPGDVM